MTLRVIYEPKGRAIELLEELRKPYYLKEDLRQKLGKVSS